MKKVMILMLSLMMLSGSAMAQMTEQRELSLRPKRVRMTQEQMTEKMISELKLDEKQAKKVTKLNKKFKTLIEGEQQDNMKGQRPPMGQGRPDGNRGGGRPSGGFGGGMPGGGMGGPGGAGGFGGGMQGGPRGGMPPGGSDSQQASYDYDKQQTKYDNQMRKMLSDEQYEGYLKLKPQFYSQRRVREFLMGGNNMNGEMGMPPGGFGGGPGSRQKDIKYTGATSLTAATIETGKTYESSKTDECALLISTKEALTISQPNINKTGDSDGGDNCSFYGVNAALLVKGGSTTTIKGGTISSSAMGANGVFSYGGNGGRNGAEGDGTTVIIEDTKITTTGNGSGGIMTTGGGVTKAKNLTVNTSGRSSAPIRSDRGGGIVTVEGGCYTSSGQGSPVIYSTADITVSNAVLTSTMSEGAVIEGKNSITLNNCQMTVSNTRRNSHAQFFDGIMLFQSFSGDAATGNSHFTMNGGTLKNQQGHLFHVTNTNAIITLNGVKLVNEDPAMVLLSVCADGWQGAGNKATLNAVSQQLDGNILVGSDSELTLTLTDGSSFTGSIGGNITNAAGNIVSTETGKVDVTLDEGCTWNLTADTYITSFTGDASHIKSNGHCLYVNGKELKTKE
ncbi:hypothetical protein [Prevotella sp. P6B4]|uniref:hypothetical protein n=1 Tax=Prevotella sp. P6B4 TaxID=1410614 RepID=UPI001E5E28B5|nr:hypothetical protein [Prevotella sp. P6B4]